MTLTEERGPTDDDLPEPVVPPLELIGASKQFGVQWALRDVSLRLEAGQVHGLAGENGAGKLTCVGLISGRIHPTTGEIRVFGEPMSHLSPRASRSLGVSTVYQELTVIPTLSAMENVFLGSVPRYGPNLVRQRVMLHRYAEVTARLGLDIPPNTSVRELSTGDRQLLEISRALVRGGRVLLLDEPTAALGEADKARLLAVVGALRDDGMAVAFVTHDLDEILEASDIVTVFRNGRLIRTAPTAEWQRSTLIQAMAGEEKDRPSPAERPPEPIGVSRVVVRHDGALEPARELGTDLLDARGITVARKATTLDLTVPAGAIMGVAGLMGSGRSSLLQAVAGVIPITGGSMCIDGTAVPWPRSVKRALGMGLRYLPEDRKGNGLLLTATALENIMLGSWDRVAQASVIDRREARRRAVVAAEAVLLDPAALRRPTAQLSGGTQQKVLLARALCSGCRVLLADEPTRGVDVNARQEIWATLRTFVAGGNAVVAAVSDIDELLELADRVLVVPSAGHGTVITDLHRRTDVQNKHDILEAMFSNG